MASCRHLKDVRAQKFPRTDFFKLATQKDYDILLPKSKKKLGVTDFVLERTASKNTLNLKNRASLADKATVSVSTKILLSDLLNEMFSAKYCFSGPIKCI